MENCSSVATFPRRIKYCLQILGNESNFLIKLSNFSKFTEYITDSVRYVQQNLRH